MLVCNICGSTKFKAFGPAQRADAQCTSCRSLERHRALHYILKEEGWLSIAKGERRCLQLAPEKVTHDYLKEAFGSGYLASDLCPEKYPHANCLKLRLPEGFDLFPDGYFDLIVHNHVLEHIPGSYKEHINAFHRILAPGGVMAFTIPEFRIRHGHETTLEGGENLETDEERQKLYGQIDHFKSFGTDLLAYLKQHFEGFKSLLLEDSELSASLIKQHNASGLILWCAK